MVGIGTGVTTTLACLAATGPQYVQMAGLLTAGTVQNQLVLQNSVATMRGGYAGLIIVKGKSLSLICSTAQALHD
jgi:hypothetical protein